MNRVCRVCGIEKPLTTEFYYKKSRSEELRTYCKECGKENNNKFSNKKQNEFGASISYEKQFPVPYKLIYGIVDNNNNVVYIGESKQGPARLHTHLSGKKTTAKQFHNHEISLEELKKYSYVVLWDGTDKSKQDRLLLEAVLIQSLRPKYNKQWQQED